MLKTLNIFFKIGDNGDFFWWTENWAHFLISVQERQAIFKAFMTTAICYNSNSSFLF